jgi:hypothetical protein
MPDFLKTPFSNGPTIEPFDVLVRLVVALVFGCLVAGVYRLSRKGTEAMLSFPTTLVLLTILIAMVTQVIGDNIARAFSLVGALSIVRFRTVVRDTQDTAYVIFAVVVGMAVGARNPWVALIGIGVVGGAAVALMARSRNHYKTEPEFLLRLRVALHLDLEKLEGGTLKQCVQESELLSIGTVKQGALVEATYKVRLRASTTPGQVLALLNQTEGVAGVQLNRHGFDED